MKFKLDANTQNPTEISEYKHVDAHFMIEEFMLLANIAVAEKISFHFPTFAIMRRHPRPKDKEIGELSEILSKCGYEFTVETSKAFADSLDKADRGPNDPHFNKLIRIMATRCMNQAVYFPLGECDLTEAFHYGLACKLYTHFTSPIRRYADVLVHRLLAAAIDIASLSNDMTDKFKLAKQCDQMNRKNRQAAQAGQASTQFNTFQFFRTQRDKNLHVTRAIVMRIAAGAGIYVQIAKYGIENLLVEDAEDKKGYKCTRITPDNDEAKVTVVENGKSTEYTVRMFDHVRVEIDAQMVEYRRSINLRFRGLMTPVGDSN